MSPAVIASLKASRLLPAGALTLSAPPAAAGLRRRPGAQVEAPPAGMQAPRCPAASRGRDPRTRLHRRGRRRRPPRSRGQSETRRARRAARPRRSPPHRWRPRRARLPQRQPGLSRSLHRGRARRIRSSLRVARGRLYVRVSSTIDAAERLAIDGPGAVRGVPGRRRIPRRRRRHRRRRSRARRAARPGRAVERRRQRAGAAGPPRGGPRRRRADHARVEQRRPDHARALGGRSRSAVAERPVRRRGSTCPASSTTYAVTFDRYGTWQNDDTYGAVWYPTSTAEDWRPYYDGRWDYTVELRLDLDRRRRRLGLPHAPLRPLAPRLARAGTGFPRAAGARRGSTGRSRRLRRLVPARLEWPAGPQRLPLRPQLHVAVARSVPRLDGDPAHVVRPGARAARVRATAAGSIATGRRSSCSIAAPGVAPPRSPYPSPFNPRLNARHGRQRRAPSRGGVSTTSPRSYGRYGSDRDSRGGHAVPRGTTSEEGTPASSPYERAQPVHAAPGCRDCRRRQRLPPRAGRRVAGTLARTARGAIDASAGTGGTTTGEATTGATTTGGAAPAMPVPATASAIRRARRVPPNGTAVRA